jgi:hypothetical protein
MAALTSARWAPTKTIKAKLFPLAGSTKCFRGGMACADTSNGTVTSGKASTTLIPIGQFEADIDNSASTATQLVQVRLNREVLCAWFDNATGANKVVAANLFSNVYVQDDHTVTLASAGNSVAGRVWELDADLGVLVQMNQF